MSKRKNPTIRDVASAAGVSIATVSKFINRQQTFSSAVEAKITAAVEELGYYQNPAARSMVTGKTTSIGLAVMDISNPYYASVVKGANRIALENGYNLLVVDMEESLARVKQLLEALSQRTDGLIVSSRLPQEVIDWLTDLGKPVVFLGQPGKTKIFSVGMNSTIITRLLARYFIQQGYSRIAYIGFERATWNKTRIAGLREVIEDAGKELVVVDAGGPTAEAGEQVAAQVLLESNAPDAVIGWNDQVAIGFMAQARALGFRIPQDVAVAGIDNIPTGRYVSPPLTTVDTRSEETGEAVVRCIMAMVQGENIKEPDLEPRLIIRESAKRLQTK